MTFGESISTCLSKYATFSGRASRSEYWWFFLFSNLPYIAVSIFDLPDAISTPGLIFQLGMTIPLFAAGARRLHDTGTTGWLQLLYLTILGSVFVWFWLVRDGDKGENEYGPSSLEVPKPDSAFDDNSGRRSQYSGIDAEGLQASSSFESENNLVSRQPQRSSVLQGRECPQSNIAVSDWYSQVATELERKEINQGLWLKARIQASKAGLETDLVYAELRLEQLEEEANRKSEVLESEHQDAKASSRSNNTPRQTASFDGANTPRRVPQSTERGARALKTASTLRSTKGESLSTPKKTDGLDDVPLVVTCTSCGSLTTRASKVCVRCQAF